MDPRNKLSRLVVITVYTLVMLVTSGSCAPTLGGFVEKGEHLEIDTEGRVNITPIKTAQPVEPLIANLNSSGQFSIRDDLPEGQYLIEVMVPGYEIISKTITVPSKEPIRITLKKIQKLELQSIKVNSREESDSNGFGGVNLNPPNF